jgi:lysophospholipase L1-like esterase
VGNCKNGDVGFEAFGGWYWVSFMSGKSDAVWVEAPNKLVVGDQHAVWKDVDGNLWQLETLQVDYLKFKRYGENTAEKPAGDTLYPFKNNVTQTPIKFYSSSNESVSPFLDKETKEIDVKKYLERSNIDGIDAVYVLLGVNGIMRTIAFTLSWKEYCKIVIKEAKELVAKLREANPNLKVKILSPVLPSCKGGMGSNYGAEPPFNDYYDIVDYLMELCIAYKEWCNEPDSKDYMEYVNLSGQFDSENAYPSIQKPVNVRSTVTEYFEVNGFHPTIVGQMQIADGVFRNVVKEFCK